MQRVVADAARSLGCSVKSLRYRPADVPMVGEFAGEQAIDTGERASVVARFKGKGGGRSLISSPIPMASRSPAPSAGNAILSPA